MEPTSKTLIVLGAGASVEIGMPTGAELKSKIADLLDIRFDFPNQLVSGDQWITGAIQRFTGPAGDFNLLRHVCIRIRDAMPQALSIDHFLDAHSDDKKIELCGKLGIVRAILDAEGDSHLSFDQRKGEKTFDFGRIEDTWYTRFFQLVIEGCTADDLEERLSHLAFVIFNYDRAFEHYLFFALQNYFSVTEGRAAELVSGIEIYHPYGKVGNLPWLEPGNSIPFGGAPGSNQLLELSGQIRTFNEGTDPNSSNIDKIREVVSTSSRILFLGFAFHRMNMELLKSKMSPKTRRQCYGTAFGFSDPDCDHIRNDINSLAPVPMEEVFLENEHKCNELLNRYSRSLSFV